MSIVAEETLNVVLAQLLLKRSLRALGEARIPNIGVRKPDVFILVNGVKVILEGKYKRAGARKELEKKCQQRIDEGLCEICVSVEYPFTFDNFLSPTMDDVENMLLTRDMDVNVSWLSAEGIKRTGWMSVGIDELANLIRISYTSIVGEDILGPAVESLKKTIEEATERLLRISNVETLAERVREAMGLHSAEG